jgi:tol-pal system protein YbgF
MNTRKSGLAATLGALVLTGCATTPPSEDPVLLKLDELDGRLERVERVVNNDSLIQLAAQIEAMQLELRQIRGEVETLRFDTESAAARQRDQYLDIDRRLQNLASGAGGGYPAAPSGGVGAGTVAGATAAGAAAGAAVTGGSTGSDRVLYQQAFDQLKEQRYDDARRSFERFLSEYPDSQLADNGQYWLGETYYVGQDFEAALREFQKVIDGYPTSRKVPDALLKIGYCQDELGQNAAARAALSEVTGKYPESTAARLARQRLAELDASGR